MPYPYKRAPLFFPASATEEEDGLMARQGSTGNVIAAVCSFFIPGLGQLVQGRVAMALVHFVLAGILWYFLLGWIIHLWSIIDAARFSPHPQ
jgi:TM2 domain-containing membrane protein YozV